MPRQSTPHRTVSQSAHIPKSDPKAGRPLAPGYGLAEDEKGLLPWTWVTKKMSDCHAFWVATVHPSNRPHVMPVWGVWVDDAFYFSTGRKSRKGRNLAANPACTVTNDDGEEAVIVEGSVEEVKDAAALERVAAAYKKKYKMDPRSMGERDFCGASAGSVRVYRGELPEVGDAVATGELMARQQPVFARRR